MVGVPGKSKGCATCRRRKIRCDLQVPACKKCTQSGRECEGYARFPVFLNKTIEGSEKRYGLEEAKTPLRPRTAFSPLTEQVAPSTRSMLSNVNYLRETLEVRAPADHRMLLVPSVSAVLDSQLISLFWEKYVPADYVVQGGSPCIWMEQIIALPSLGETLQLSLKALAMTRLAWINNDDSMALQGNVIYGRALQSLQHSLWREDKAMHDDVFVAGYICAIYELFESTTTSVAGWNSHIAGLSQLVLARGPHRHRSPIARATLEEFRTSAMIQCIQYRKSIFLGTEEWRSIPWEITPKDVYQKLYDKGFAFGALLEEIDNADLLTPSASTSALLAFLNRLSSLNIEMDQWYQELLSKCPSPLYWTTLPRSHTASTSTGGHLQEALESGSMPPFAFSTLRMANITLTYWAIRIILSSTIAGTCGAIMSTDTLLLRVEFSNSGDLRGMAQQQLNLHSDRIRLEYATNIMRSMPYCLSENMGLLGAQKSLFALRTALASLSRRPGEELKRCQAVYQQMHNRKGIRYAREIAQLDVSFGPNGRDSLPMRVRETNPPHPSNEGQAASSSAQSFSPSIRPPAFSETQLPDLDEGLITDACRQDADARVSSTSPPQGAFPPEDHSA